MWEKRQRSKTGLRPVKVRTVVCYDDIQKMVGMNVVYLLILNCAHFKTWEHSKVCSKCWFGRTLNPA